MLNSFEWGLSRKAQTEAQLTAPLAYLADGARVTFLSTLSSPGMVRPWPKLPSLSPPTGSCLRDTRTLAYQSQQSYSQTLESAASSVHLCWQPAHVLRVSEGSASL